MHRNIMAERGTGIFEVAAVYFVEFRVNVFFFAYFSLRAVLYIIVEDLLTSFGMDGKACLLRAICEVHSHSSIQKFGLIGEIVQLFFS